VELNRSFEILINNQPFLFQSIDKIENLIDTTKRFSISEVLLLIGFDYDSNSNHDGMNISNTVLKNSTSELNEKVLDDLNVQFEKKNLVTFNSTSVKVKKNNQSGVTAEEALLVLEIERIFDTTEKLDWTENERKLSQKMFEALLFLAGEKKFQDKYLKKFFIDKKMYSANDSHSGEGYVSYMKSQINSGHLSNESSKTGKPDATSTNGFFYLEVKSERNSGDKNKAIYNCEYKVLTQGLDRVTADGMIRQGFLKSSISIAVTHRHAWIICYKNDFSDFRDSSKAWEKIIILEIDHGTILQLWRILSEAYYDFFFQEDALILTKTLAALSIDWKCCLVNLLNISQHRVYKCIPAINDNQLCDYAFVVFKLLEF
jgi:hypothetical protein